MNTLFNRIASFFCYTNIQDELALKELTKKPIFCTDCGRVLAKYSIIDTYDAFTGKPNSVDLFICKACDRYADTYHYVNWYMRKIETLDEHIEKELRSKMNVKTTRRAVI